MTMIFERYGLSKEKCIISSKANSDDRMINLIKLDSTEFEVGRDYFEEYYLPTGRNLVQ